MEVTEELRKLKTVLFIIYYSKSNENNNPLKLAEPSQQPPTTMYSQNTRKNFSLRDLENCVKHIREKNEQD